MLAVGTPTPAVEGGSSCTLGLQARQAAGWVELPDDLAWLDRRERFQRFWEQVKASLESMSSRAARRDAV